MFFKGTIPVNLAISCAGLLFGDLSLAFILYLTLGYVVSLSVIEARSQNEYLFYFNNGITKLQLWLFSYLVSVLFAVVGATAIILIISVF